MYRKSQMHAVPRDSTARPKVWRPGARAKREVLFARSSSRLPDAHQETPRRGVALQRRLACPMPASFGQKGTSARSASSLAPSPTTRRRGDAVLLHEPSPGLDKVYDGAHQMKSMAFLFGPKGTKWATSQAYGASFRSATPRPWNRSPSRAERNSPVLGPGSYEPNRDTHSLSASISWAARGRSGPIGFPFEGTRRSPPFRSDVHRFRFAAKEQRGGYSNEGCFVLSSDARRQQLQRADFVDQLQRGARQNVGFQGAQRLMTAPGI